MHQVTSSLPRSTRATSDPIHQPLPFLAHVLSASLAAAAIMLFVPVSGAALGAPPDRDPGPPGQTGNLSTLASLPDPAGRNLLANAELSRGQTSWTLEAGPPADASVEILDGANGPRGVAGRVVRVNVRSVGKEPWSVQFQQTALDLEDEEVYTLSFWARCDRVRTMSVHTNVDAGDGHGSGLNADAVTIGPEWTRYAFLFTVTGAMHSHNRLTFLLGSTPGTIDLSGLSLRQGKVTQPSGTNIVANGDFTQATRFWSLERSLPTAAATMDLATTMLVADSGRRNVAHFNVTGLGKERWHVMFVQPGLNVFEGQPYTLSFWAKADHSRPITVEMGLDLNDWHNIGLSHRVELLPEWRRYDVTFTPLHTVRDHTRLSFLLADALGQVDLANVSLQREIAPASNDLRTVTAPALAGDDPTASARAHRSSPAVAARHPLVGMWESQTADGHQRVRFTFNADGTGSIRTGASTAELDAVPQARVQNAFRWNMVGSEHKVVIGGDTYSWDISGSGKGEKLTLRSRAGKAHVFDRR